MIDVRKSLTKAITLPAAPANPSYWSPWLVPFLIGWLVALFLLFPNPGPLVRQNWPLVLVGFLGALLGNATAVGGGIVYIPVMLIVYQLPPVTALKVALGSQSFGMTSGALSWLKQGVVSKQLLVVSVPALLLGSMISSLVIQPNALLVKGLFGPVSIFIGVVTLLLLDRKGSHDDVPRLAVLLLPGFAFVGGLLTGWVAIGEGEVVAAFLMLAFGLHATRGIGLGVVLLAINSLFLTLLHILFLGGLPWDIVLFTGLGCVFGGRLGPYLSHWLGPRRLKIFFATIAIVDGALILLQFLLTH